MGQLFTGMTVLLSNIVKGPSCSDKSDEGHSSDNLKK